MSAEQGGHPADYDAVLEAARWVLRTGARPTRHSATAHVNAAALDALRAAVARVTPPASPAPERDRAAEVEAAEDRAEQAAFDAARERS